jgi:AraC-like DNA-binding protein
MKDGVLKEQIIHGNILFNFAVHFTEQKTATEIMLYTHWHEELEILYILNGSMLLQVDTESFIVSKGDIIFIPPNLIHGATCCNDTPCDFYAIVFHPSFIQSSLNDVIQQRYIEPFLLKITKKYYYNNGKLKELDNLRTTVTNIIETYNLKCFGFELLIKSYVLQILFLMIEFHSNVKERSGKDDVLTINRIKKILIFLEANYQKQFSLADWASCIYLSKEQFSRIFKNYFNTTPIDYLVNYRINKAADLLISTDRSIIDISLDTGFQSANYFAIAFKNKTRMTPRAFRNSYE